MKMREFNLFFIGDGEVGKTTFIKRYDARARFQKEYTRTEELELHPMVFYTTHGPIKFNVYDTVGQDTLFQTKSRHASNFKAAHCVIVMFDVTRSETLDHFHRWCRNIVDACENENLPIVLIGNKCDLVMERRVSEDEIEKRLQTACYQMNYYDVSAKSGLNYSKPFIFLARKLLEDDQLDLIEEPALQPFAHQFDDATWNKCDDEKMAGMEEMVTMPLPDDDSDFDDL